MNIGDVYVERVQCGFCALLRLSVKSVRGIFTGLFSFLKRVPYLEEFLLVLMVSFWFFYVILFCYVAYVIYRCELKQHAKERTYKLKYKHPECLQSATVISEME